MLNIILLFSLQFVEMPIVSRPDCQEDYSGVNGVDDGMICAGIDEGGELFIYLNSPANLKASIRDASFIWYKYLVQSYFI